MFFFEIWPLVFMINWCICRLLLEEVRKDDAALIEYFSSASSPSLLPRLEAYPPKMAVE